MNNAKPLAIAVSLLVLGACKKESRDTAEPDNQKHEPAPEVTGDDSPSGAAGFGDAAGTYKLDPVHSAIAFKVKHMGVSHTLGLFNKVTGELVLGAAPAGSSVSLAVDAASIFTANKKRDDHLKSPDFLNVAQFPTIGFKSTAVERAGDDRYKVTGDLTLHGVTRSVTTELTHVGAGKSMMDDKTFLTGFTGELSIKRSDFEMTNMVGPAGDQIDLTIAIEAIRQ